MSNHDVGRGLNAVVKTTIELYDANQLDREVAKKIISSCGQAVNWADGNSYEALDYIYNCRCGKCLKMVPRGEHLYSVDDVSNKVPDFYSISDQEELATPRLCEDCFNEIICQHCNDPAAGKREMEYIQSEYGEDSCASEGNYPDTNNGCPWPKSKR